MSFDWPFLVMARRSAGHPGGPCDYLRIFGAAVALMLAVRPAFADCLKYEPAKVTLTGVIRTRVDFGPPNYGETPATDSKEEHIYLHLDKTVCVDGDPKSEVNSDSEANIQTMQMVYFLEVPFRKEWLGKHVSVTGTLFHQITAHHWTKVLIIARETHIIAGEKSR